MIKCYIFNLKKCHCYQMIRLHFGKKNRMTHRDCSTSVSVFNDITKKNEIVYESAKLEFLVSKPKQVVQSSQSVF